MGGFVINRGVAVIMLLGIVSTLAVIWHVDYSLNDAERVLFNRINTSLMRSPPQASDIAEAFELLRKCQETCFFDAGNISQFGYTKGNLRPSDDGLVFEIEGFSSCIRSERVLTHFGADMPAERCSHGGCWYMETQFSWGILAFGVDSPDAQCVHSVVINSHTYQRPGGS